MALQVVISTGKTNWVREVTDESNSLASYLDAASSSSSSVVVPATDKAKINGLFDSSQSSRTSILNGSHHSISSAPGKETVLIFPDYILASDVPKSIDGAQALWDNAVDPAVPDGGLHKVGEGFDSWVLPYSAVILLCQWAAECALASYSNFDVLGSHKRRDNRCAISAPKLEHRKQHFPLHYCPSHQDVPKTGFRESLEARGWTVDTQINEHGLSSPLDDTTKNTRTEQLRSLPAQKHALILMISHIGGHKFAGNVNVRNYLASAFYTERVMHRSTYREESAFGTVA